MAKKVLTVEDSAPLREMLRGVLVEAGYQVVEASDGQEAIDYVERNRDVALVLCDVHMPELDGVDTVIAIRADARNARLPIVMLTAETDFNVIERAKKAGIKGWIVKPVRPELLIATVRKLIGR